MHFASFDQMGLRGDSETVPLESVRKVRGLSTGGLGFSTDAVEPVVDVPPKSDSARLFCRFAICCSASKAVACLTPVASHLLRRADRSKSRKFNAISAPIVFDLSPDVLGASEGFSQANFQINTALGFDKEKHVTWRIRHPTAQVFDHPATKVFEDIESGKLHHMTLPDPTPPKICLVAGECGYFRLNDTHKMMPSLKQFSKPLSIIPKAAEALSADFFVLLMSPGILHQDAIQTFSTSLLTLLTKRMSVHLRLTPLKEHGLPQDRSIITIIASPQCTPLAWSSDWPETSPQPPVCLNDVLEDLAFHNPQAMDSDGSGFVCSSPGPQPETESRRSRYIYNHVTGQNPINNNQGTVEVDMSSSLNISHGSQQWIHPGKLIS